MSHSDKSIIIMDNLYWNGQYFAIYLVMQQGTISLYKIIRRTIIKIGKDYDVYYYRA